MKKRTLPKCDMYLKFRTHMMLWQCPLFVLNFILNSGNFIEIVPKEEDNSSI